MGPWEELGTCDGGGGGGGDDDRACTGVRDWDSGRVYTGSDHVVYDGSLWEVQWWTEDDEPGASQWGPWNELESCSGDGGENNPPGGDPVDRSLSDIAPKPADVTTDPGASFEITADTTIAVDDGAMDVGTYLAGLVAPATGFALSVESGSGDATNTIAFSLSGDAAHIGDEDYELLVTASGVTIDANTETGLFWGVQSLQQVFPAAVEADSKQSVDWVVPGGEVTDSPRFEYRGRCSMWLATSLTSRRSQMSSVRWRCTRSTDSICT
jgi:chitodextrinase